MFWNHSKMVKFKYKKRAKIISKKSEGVKNAGYMQRMWSNIYN